MNKIIFLIILLVILIIFYIFKLNENFEIQEENSGVFNYFYGKIMNPYRYPMLKFFNNDIQQPIDS